MKDSAEAMPAAQEPNRVVGLDGDDLRKAFEAATHCLERHREAINALNVFPVPDGDTGTNMLLTMRSVNEESVQAPGSSAGVVMAAMAHGALLGARGNSGVILSQFFHGLAQGLQGKDELDGESLAQAFELASRAAYSSVSKPVDGTMLTVIRELSLAASRYVRGVGGSRDVLSVWQAALEAAKEALSRTPLQLPVLREAGVVDAGGQGVVTLLEGAWRYLSGENVDEMELELCVPSYLDTASGDVSPGGQRSPVGALGKRDERSGQAASLPAVQEDYLATTEDELYGYCTQFLIRSYAEGEGRSLDVDRIREELSAIAESTVVVGNEGLVKVHVHAHDPGPVISYAVDLGAIDQVSIDNMDPQHREFVARHRGEPTYHTFNALSPIGALQVPEGHEEPEVAVAVVAVAWGEGFVRLFKGLGCATVITGGQTMNPSTQELLNAAMSTGAREVILLPNNPNIIPAAKQAVSIAGERPPAQPPAGTEGPGQGPVLSEAEGMKLHVIPSRTIPQGVAALLVFNPEGALDSNLEPMEVALATVKTIEVTRAVRPATLGGLVVQEGQYIGLLEGDLVAAGDSAISALQQALHLAQDRLLMEDRPGNLYGTKCLVTLYWGGDIQEGEAGKAAAQLQESIPEVEVEVVYGGQPFYQYIASLE